MVWSHLIWSDVFILRLSIKQLLPQHIPLLKFYIAAISLGSCVWLHRTILKGCCGITHYTIWHAEDGASEPLTPSVHSNYVDNPRTVYSPYILWIYPCGSAGELSNNAAGFERYTRRCWWRNVGCGCLRIGCWGEYLFLRGTR